VTIIATDLEQAMQDWALRQAEQRGLDAAAVLQPDFNLAEAGLLDSFSVVDLLVSLAAAGNGALDVETLNLDGCETLGDLRRIMTSA
jgi:hypothetical protein